MSKNTTAQVRVNVPDSGEGRANTIEFNQTGSKKRRGRPPGRSSKSVQLIQFMYDTAAVIQPVTGRGIGYKLFVAKLITSMSRGDMQAVYRLLKEAREEGTIPWGWIVDESRGLEGVPTWDDPDAFAQHLAKLYRRDFWQSQPHRIQTWSEKGTVRSLLKSLLDEFAIDFNPVHGFNSATNVHEICADGDKRPLHILYVGDFDPSGLFMSEVDLPRRLAEYGGHHIRLKRIAVTREQTGGLISFPAADKQQDPRYSWFIQNHGNYCWELDAMDPRDLRAVVRKEIEALIDKEAWERYLVVNKAEQESMCSFAAERKNWMLNGSSEPPSIEPDAWPHHTAPDKQQEAMRTFVDGWNGGDEVQDVNPDLGFPWSPHSI
jgi:hypothetical protein